MANFFKKVLQSITVQSVQGFDCEKEPTFVQGSWKVYSAKNKQRLGSVWICDSKQQTVPRREYTSLIKLKYPGILQVLEPLVDEKSYIAFVSERIECTLAQALNDSKWQISELEQKLHILEIIDGLQFLHNNVRQVHLDLCPDKIFFTEGGKWKIGGSPLQQQVLGNLTECANIDLNERFSPHKLNYMAPELLQAKPQCSNGTDIFSLAMVILRLMRSKHNRISFPEYAQSDQYLQFMHTYPQEILRYKDLFPENLLRSLSSMLAPQIQSRPTLAQFVQIEWFKDPYLITFNTLNKLPEFDMNQQIAFFRGLSTVIFTFEKLMLQKRLLPIILALVHYEHLLTPIVQIILETLRRDDILTPPQFRADVWPKMKQIIHGKEIPAQVLYDLVLGLPILHKYIPQTEINEHLIPLLIKCYECRVPKLQDLALRVTEFVLEHSDYTFSKTKIVPRIFSLLLDQNIETRKTALICVYKTLNVMDADAVLASLEKLKPLGTDRELNQIVLKIYQALAKTLSSDVVATKLLPQITPYLTDTTLSKSEFNEYYDALLQMLAKIKADKEKSLSDHDKGIITVDYKLALPEPKRIVDGVGNKFEFLLQFDTGVAITPDKPSIQFPAQQPSAQQGQASSQPSQPVLKQQGALPHPFESIPQGVPVKNDPFGFIMNQQAAQPLQTGQPLVQAGQPLASAIGQPVVSPLPPAVQQTYPAYDGFNSFDVNSFLQGQPKAPATQSQFISNPVVQGPPVTAQTWGLEGGSLSESRKQGQAQLQGQPQRPLFNQQGLPSLSTQSQVLDPFNTQQQWSLTDAWQQPQPQPQPQTSQLFQPIQQQQQQSQTINKSKYASFDELI